MKLNVVKGATDVSIYLFIQDSSVSTGAGLTGLLFNSAGLTCYYVRPLAAAVQLALATQTVTGAHSDGGFVEVSAANMPGIYRLDLSDAIVASGVDSVSLLLKGATNMVPVPIEIQLVANNPSTGVMAAAANEAVADALLGRTLGGGGNGSRTVNQALQALRNRVAITGATFDTLTVYGNDDATPSWTGAVARQPSLAPIVDVNPT